MKINRCCRITAGRIETADFREEDSGQSKECPPFHRPDNCDGQTSGVSQRFQARITGAEFVITEGDGEESQQGLIPWFADFERTISPRYNRGNAGRRDRNVLVETGRRAAGRKWRSTKMA